MMDIVSTFDECTLANLSQEPFSIATVDKCRCNSKYLEAMMSIIVRYNKANVHHLRAAKKCNLGFMSFVNDFLTYLEAGGCATSTILCYLRDLGWLAELLGDKRLNAVRDKDIERVIVWLSEYNRGSSRRSAATMNRIKSAYRSFFGWAFESGRISINPAARLLLAKTSSRPTTPISRGEIELLLSTIRKSGDQRAGRDEALFATYAFTGIRRTEALYLREKDYDPVSCTLYLRQTKGGKKRMQFVTAELAEILKRHITTLKRRDKSGEDKPLFLGCHHELPLSAREAQVRFDKWKTVSGIRKNLTIHSFRAGFATLLYQTTKDLLLVASVMGHADVSSTKRYIRDDMLAVRAAIERTFQGQTFSSE